MLQLIARQDKASHWNVPPVLEGHEAVDWSFDIRPDCSYWLSLRGYNRRYQIQVRNATYVMDNRITFPYLTVEVKGGGEPQSVAMMQVAAAGSLALYNRYQLRRNALKEMERDWTSGDTALLRHYALTFVGTEFDFWMLQVAPVGVDGCWTGCIMTKLYAGDLYGRVWGKRPGGLGQ